MNRKLTNKAVQYMKLIGLDESMQKAIRKGLIYCSIEPFGSVTKINEGLQTLIDYIESVSESLVWHVIGGFYDYCGEVHEMYTFLLATDNYATPSDTKYNNNGLYFSFSRVVNLRRPELSEYGDVHLMKKNEGVVRVCRGIRSLYPPLWHNPQEMCDMGLDYNSPRIEGPHIEIPEKYKEIRAKAFINRGDIKSVNIKNGITKIGNVAFCGCIDLAEINIPDSVIDIEACAFYDTAWFYNKPDGVIYAGKVVYMYKGEVPDNAHIVINDGTVAITDEAFAYCFTGNSNISLTIPSSVVKIGERLFEHCMEDNKMYVTIHCQRETAAHNYAIENNIKFELRT